MSFPAASSRLPVAGCMSCKVLVPQQIRDLGHRGKLWWNASIVALCGLSSRERQGGDVLPVCTITTAKTVHGRLSWLSHTRSDALRWAQAKPAVGSIPELQAGLFGECRLESRCGAHSWHVSLEQAKPKPQICIISYHFWGLQNSAQALQPDTSALELLQRTRGSDSAY